MRTSFVTRRSFLLAASSVGICSAIGTTYLRGSTGTRPILKLAATTTLRDSGLLGALVGAFSDQHDIDVRAIVRGTGEVLMLARNGDVDAVLIHDPVKEAEFARKGFVNTDDIILENRFVLVGPASLFLDGKKKEVMSALRTIYEKKIPFVSRGDASGTHAAELRLWSKLRLSPEKFATDWYWESGSGMGATLNIAASSGRTTLTDIATWEYFNNKNDMTILADTPGSPLTRNVYSYLTLKSATAATSTPQKFGQWLGSDDCRSLIRNFRINGKKVFFLPVNPIRTATAS